MTRNVLAQSAAIAASILIVLSLAPGAVLATRPPAATCNLSPGDTSVSWRSSPKTTSVEIRWYDAGGTQIASVTVTPTRAMHFRYTQPTPTGAAEFGVDFSDAGGVYGVTGGQCL